GPLGHPFVSHHFSARTEQGARHSHRASPLGHAVVLASPCGVNAPQCLTPSLGTTEGGSSLLEGPLPQGLPRGRSDRSPCIHRCGLFGAAAYDRGRLLCWRAQSVYVLPSFRWHIAHPF